MSFIKKIFSFFWDKSLVIFLIIGGLNTIVSMAGSQLLYITLGYWGSTILMFAICSIFSFIFNRKYSFKSNAPLLQSLFRFTIVIAICYVISFGLSDIIMPLICNALFPTLTVQWVERLAMLLAQCIFTACNYIGQRLWAFKE